MNAPHSLLLAALLIAPAFGQVQNEDSQFLATPGQEHAWFGSSNATSGTRMIVGAPYQDNANGARAGSVFVFDLATGQQTATLLSSDTGDHQYFGFSLALQGNLAVIGSMGIDRAYVVDVTTGQVLHRLVPSHGGQGFGSSVAIHGNRIVVGAFAEGAGAAYVFDAGSGLQLQRLKPVGISVTSRMGYSIAIRGTLVVAGAPESGSRSYYGSGSVHVFDLNTGQQILKLLASDEQAFNNFGNSVALSDHHLLVGSRLSDDFGSNSGAAYLFDPQNNFQEIAELHPNDASSGDFFGSGVALNENYALIGSSNNDDAGISSGSAYLFDLSTQQQVMKFRPYAGLPEAIFGVSLDLSETTAVVGAPGNGQQGLKSGATYRFSLPTQNPGQGFCYGDGSSSACPCGANGGPQEGCANTSGGGARLVGMGGTSLSDDWFMLNVLNVPDQKPGLLLRGSSMVNAGQGTLIGDGLLCTTGQAARSQVVISSNGTSAFGNFQGSPFGASSYGAGVPTYYQFWYRDPANTCSGSGFNFSNAWEVNWTL